jgi:probable phosphoglycerate mutase
MKLILTRHGETHWNLLRKTQGGTDTELTEKGRKQARLLAGRLRGEKIDVIYSSSLSRARETAQIISAVTGAGVVSDPDLNEYGFGQWEGRHIDALKQEYPDVYKVWETSPASCVIPDAEHFPSYSLRILGFLEKVRKAHDSDTVMVVTHQLTSKLLITNALGITNNLIHSFRVDNASYNVLHFRPRRVVLERLNDTAHLNEDLG